MRSTFMWVALCATTVVMALGCGDPPAGDIEQQSSAISEVGVGGVRAAYAFFDSDGRQYLMYPHATTKKVTLRSLTIASHEASMARTVGTATTTCAPAGYVRSDGVNAIVYIDTAGHLHEIANFLDALLSDWFDGDFRTHPSINAPLGSTAAGCEVFAYVRTDGANAIVYRGTDNHIYEVKSNFQGNPPGAPWIATDLTLLNARTPSVGRGNPVPYHRRNGLDAIVYVATDNHIHELKANFNGAPKWLHTDLSVASGETVTAASGAWGYQRGDSVDAIVFVGSEATPKLHEISFTGGNACGRSWCPRILPTTAPVSAGERPSGFFPHGDEQAGVVYLSPVSGSTPTLRKLKLQNGGWTDEALTLSSGAFSTPVSMTTFRGPISDLIMYTQKQTQAPNDTHGALVFRAALPTVPPSPWETFVF